MKRIAILGGGISGLSAAYFAKKAGHHVALFEKEFVAGGLIQSEKTDYGIVDLGPSSIRDTDGMVMNLVHELGLENQVLVMDESGKTRYLVRDKKIHTIKPNPFSFLGSPILSKKGKFRLFAEPFKSSSGNSNNESLASFMSRRIGSEAVEQLLDPVMSGIYAGDVDKMNAEVVVPKMFGWEKEYGSLLKGALKSRKASPKVDSKQEKPKSLVLNFKGGLATLTAALEAKLSDNILRETITSISKSGQSVTTSERSYQFDETISTLPSYAIAELIQEAPELSQALKDIVYVPMFVMAVHTERNMNEELGGFGFLIPRNEGIRLLGSIHRSSIFPDLCSNQGSVFTMFSGGRKDEGILSENVDNLQNQLLEDFKNLTRYNGNVQVIAHKMWNKAIPQMETSLKIAREQITKFEKTSNLTIGGNFRWGVSLPDCMRGAKGLFETVY